MMNDNNADRDRCSHGRRFGDGCVMCDEPANGDLRMELADDVKHGEPSDILNTALVVESSPLPDIDVLRKRIVKLEMQVNAKQSYHTMVMEDIRKAFREKVLPVLMIPGLPGESAKAVREFGYDLDRF